MPPFPRSMHPFWRHAAIIAGYLLVALLITFPAVTTLSTRFIGSETGDSYEMARHIWRLSQALRQGEPLLFDALLGYPDGISATIFMTVPLQYFPAALYALILPLPLAYNVHVLLWMALNGWAMYWLMRDLLRDDPQHEAVFSVPALLAGLVYLAFPLFQGHLAEGHGGLMMGWGAPLYLWALFNLVRTEQHSGRWLAAGVFFFYLSTTGHILQAIYVLLPVSALFWAAQVWQRDWRALRRVTLLGVLAAGTTFVAFLPAITESLGESVYVETTGYVRYSADALSLISPSFLHPVFGAILDYPAAVIGTNLGEGVLYVGVVAGVLCIIGLITYRAARWWALLAGVAWLLSLGTLLKVMDKPVQLMLGEYTTYIPLPFAFMQNLPGFNLARTPGRFGFALALAVAVMAGYGAAWVWRTRKRWLQMPVLRYGSLLCLAALILFEYQIFWSMPTLPGAVPQPIADLRQRDDIRAVFNVPYQHLLAAKEAMYLQTAHQQPLIAGQLTRQTPVDPAKLAILQQALSPALLDAAGADVLIVHKSRAEQVGIALDDLATQLNNWDTPLYEDSDYAVYDIPDPQQDPQPVALDGAGNWWQLTDTYPIELYVPVPQWLLLHVIPDVKQRPFSAMLDGRLLHRWSGLDSGDIQVLPFAVTEAGYHTLTLALDNPCPVHYDDALRCDAYVQPRVEFMGGDVTMQAAFANGADLRAGRIAGDGVWLHWHFQQAIPDTDVRFVHVIDDSGNLVWQEDTALGAFDADAGWSEQVIIPVDTLPAGTYEIRIGWYDFNTVTNYLTDDAQPALMLDSIQVE